MLPYPQVYDLFSIYKTALQSIVKRINAFRDVWQRFRVAEVVQSIQGMTALLRDCHMWRISGFHVAKLVDVNDESSDKTTVCGDSNAALPSLSTLQGIGGLIQLQRLGEYK